MTPSPAESPRDPNGGGFEELWDVYGVRTKRADAKAAYDTLAPDPALHERLIDSARKWRDHYEATATESKWRKRLANWLKGECWLEDPPPAYEDAKEAAIARARERGPRRTRRSQAIEDSEDRAAPAPAFDGLSANAPIGRHVVRIVSCEIEDRDFNEQSLRCRFHIHGGRNDGEEFEHTFYLVSPSETFELEGQQYFRAIRKASGIEPKDTPDLHGAVLAAIVSKGGRIKYEAGSNLSAMAATKEPRSHRQIP